MTIGKLKSFIRHMPDSMEIADLDLRTPSGVIPGHYPVSTRGTLIIDTI